MTTCQDWRLAGADEVAMLVAAEANHWRRDLTWDVEDAWRVIEPARAAGQLAGFLARREDDSAAGWCWFMTHHGSLQVAAVVADAAETTGALVDAILASPEARDASRIVACMRDAAPAARETLVSRGFMVVDYRYLTCALTGAGAEVRSHVHSSFGEPWGPSSIERAPLLCARAYAAANDVRAFAPGGTAVEWRDYISSLVMGSGCGRFLPDASAVVRDGSPRQLTGLIVVTDLGLGTAHIAQVAVDPAAQGRGLGKQLVESARSACAAAGFERMTLLVSDANVRAAAMYERLGFKDTATFIVASR